MATVRMNRGHWVADYYDANQRRRIERPEGVVTRRRFSPVSDSALGVASGNCLKLLARPRKPERIEVGMIEVFYRGRAVAIAGEAREIRPSDSRQGSRPIITSWSLISRLISHLKRVIGKRPCRFSRFPVLTVWLVEPSTGRRSWELVT